MINEWSMINKNTHNGTRTGGKHDGPVALRELDIEPGDEAVHQIIARDLQWELLREPEVSVARTAQIKFLAHIHMHTHMHIQH